jgi:inosine/xanthosine triphosphate pyrophosphatase family protein/rhodanese-related sulfurtransferase
MPELQEQINQYIENVDGNWNYITPQELNERMQNENIDDLFLLDIRKTEDYQNGHIPGSTNIFWLDLFKPENLSKLPNDKTIVIICYVGHTASQILVLLRLLGYKTIVLKYGMGISPVAKIPISGWTNFGFEVTGKDIKFSSTNEALQYLADLTNKKVKIAEEKFTLLTSNPNKLKEYQKYIPNLSMKKGKDLPEVDSDDKTVAIHKAKDNGPMTICEDTSLEVEGSSIGTNIRWMLNNLDKLAGKKAIWKVLLAKNDGKEITLYEGVIEGEMVKPEKVSSNDFGFDPYFKVKGIDKTLKELKAESSNPLTYSARAIAANNLQKEKSIHKQKLEQIEEWSGDWQHE